MWGLLGGLEHRHTHKVDHNSKPSLTMKGTTNLLCICAVAVLATLLPRAKAGSFATDFNSGLPEKSTVYGDALIGANGGYTNSGYLQLTTAAGGQNGAFVVTNDLDAIVPVVSFTARFKILIGGGERWNYGDGLSFNFAPDVPLGTSGLPEAGVGSGVSVAFRTTPASGNPDPTITAAGTTFPVSGSPAYVDNVRANRFIDTMIQLNPDNTLSVVYDGLYVYSNAPITFTPAAGGLFWIGARCGSWFENHYLDDLAIVTHTNAMPFVNLFEPHGSQVSPRSSIDIVVTNYNTALNAGSIVLTLDGVRVAPSAMAGENFTAIHFAPAAGLAPSSRHLVTLTYADNATPPQTESFSWEFTVAEALPTNFVTLLAEDFEHYALGKVDKEPLYWSGGANGPNAAPNGSGNPWFGPYGPNCPVVNAEGAVTPHSGAKMIRGNVVGDQDALWCDLAYRFHSGQPIRGNCRLDWWQYDPYTSVTQTSFKDYVSLYYYNNETFPATSDWPAAWNNWTTSQALLFWGNGIDYTLEQSISLGASGYTQNGGNFDPAKYQVRLEENRGATYGLDGWCNTTVARSAGWHHYQILLGPPHTNGTVMVYFYIDDLSTPVYAGLSTLATTGFGLLEIVTAWGDTDQAYYDDISFALVRPPNPLVAAGQGKQVTVSWPGEGFTLQSAPTHAGPWTDIAGATSGNSYDVSTGLQFFRLRN